MTTEELIEAKLQDMALDKVRAERAQELRDMAAKLIAIAEEIEAKPSGYTLDML